MRPLEVTERVNGAFSEHAGCLERFLSLFTEATAFSGIWFNSVYINSLFRFNKMEENEDLEQSQLFTAMSLHCETHDA